MKVTVRGELRLCDDCGSAHLGPRCRSSFAARLRTNQIHNSCTPNRELKRYWDQSAIDNQFGEDATERSLDMTEGVGFNRPLTAADTAKLFE